MATLPRASAETMRVIELERTADRYERTKTYVRDIYQEVLSGKTTPENAFHNIYGYVVAYDEGEDQSNGKI